MDNNARIELLNVNMDKSWINIRNRLDPLYGKGADHFVKFASKDTPNATKILCPCTKCCNMRFLKKVDVAEHIVLYTLDFPWRIIIDFKFYSSTSRG
ncbi:hypothetical protein RJ639_041385 [Escallonia herrerae]|uniref:Transposase-associated domain-containing protein n=1 Tax=Escallonia herrerae TaxID=1293975 RepID=A0AA88WEJ5_9ASTE|nr:hypothetical protein RJ639_041385 [Escallonia herrerae]